MAKHIRLFGRVATVLITVFAVILSQSATVSAAPFTCEPDFFQSMILGQLKRLDTASSTYTIVGNSTATSLNAIGYNVLDNYIYGIDNYGAGGVVSHLIKIGLNPATDTTDLGAPSGFAAGNYVAGDMDRSGNLYTTDGTNLWKINVTTVTATSVVLSTSLSSINDFVYINGNLYATNGTSLYQVNVTTGVVTTKALGLPSAVYGAGWATVADELYFGQNSSGVIYKITNYSAPSPSATAAYGGEGGLVGNDGAACSLAASVIAAIQAVNDSSSTQKDTPLIVPSTSGLLKNDAPDNATVQSYEQPLHGTVTVQPDGSYVYTPTAGFVGIDSFTYTIVNSVEETATATVYITVSASAPVATLASTGQSQLTALFAASLLFAVFVGSSLLKRKFQTYR